MDKYKRYYGLAILAVVVILLLCLSYKLIEPSFSNNQKLKADVVQKTSELEGKRNEKRKVQAKIKQIKDLNTSIQKKIYAPVESDLGNDTLFFTLYNDIIEMVHANSVRIKSIDYTYSPNDDKFVEHGRDLYFVCDVDMELVSNYVNLGKLIQDIYQYPYYVLIRNIEVVPYSKDKSILLTNMSLRLYARTTPVDE